MHTSNMICHGLLNYADAKLPNHGKKAKIDALFSTKIDEIEFFLKKATVLSSLCSKHHVPKPETSSRKPAEFENKERISLDRLAAHLLLVRYLIYTS